LYAQNFDPNNQKYFVHVQDVDKVELPGVLMELSKKYFEQLGTAEEIQNNTKPKEEVSSEVHQCKHCLTVYEKEKGDESQGVAKGTSFDFLPASYHCPVCESPKSDFEIKVFTRQIN
jgi:rubredoxin